MWGFFKDFFICKFENWRSGLYYFFCIWPVQFCILWYYWSDFFFWRYIWISASFCVGNFRQTQTRSVNFSTRKAIIRKGSHLYYSKTNLSFLQSRTVYLANEDINICISDRLMPALDLTQCTAAVGWWFYSWKLKY